MPSEYVTVSLFRDDHQESWGFTITGGADVDEQLVISYVSFALLVRNLTTGRARFLPVKDQKA